MNYEKSVIYRIGAIRNSQCKLNVSQRMKWSSGEITSLGILIGGADAIEKNYNTVLNKAENTLKLW